jgi:hypothetical protein
MLRISHCLDNRLTDGGKFVSPMHRMRSTLQKHYFSASGTHFCYRLSKSQGLIRPEGLGKLEKSTTITSTNTNNKVKVKLSRNRPWRPIGL